MSIAGSITLAIAVLGAALGILNTWQSYDRDRIKLRVVPKIAFGVGPMMDSRNWPCIEIINRSSFPVSISQVGFLLKQANKRLISLEPTLSDRGQLPKRLESRSSISVYFDPSFAKEPNFKAVTCAFAETQCGTVVKGSSPALRSLVHTAKKGG